MVKEFTMELAGRTLRAVIGKVAEQANGAVLLYYGDTVVLSTATASEKPRTSLNSFLFSFMIAIPLSDPSLRYAKASAGFLNSERLFFTTRLTKRMISSLLYRS